MLKGDAELQFRHSGFQLIVQKLSRPTLEAAPFWCEVAWDAIRRRSGGAVNGRFTVNYIAHLQLDDAVPSEFISRYLDSDHSDKGLTPDAFAYKLVLPGHPEISQMRIVMAYSLQFERAVFVDLSTEYDGADGPVKLVREAEQHVYSALEALGLRPSDGGAS